MKVTDGTAVSNEPSFSVSVSDVAPTVTLLGPASADEGDSKHYTYSWTDPGSADTFPDHSVNCGVHGSASNELFDGSAKTGSFDCTWSDDSGANTFTTVAVAVTDDDNGVGFDSQNSRSTTSPPRSRSAARRASTKARSTA